MRIFLVGVLLASWGAVSHAQQYRDDYPEVLQPDSSNQPESLRQTGYDTAVVQQNYFASNRPLVLLMVGRTLGSASSQWQADTRDVSRSTQQAFQGGASSITRQGNVRQTDTRQMVATHMTPALQALQQGVQRYLGQAAIQTMHFDTAIRRAQQENELQGRLTREGDLRKNEADAVLKYAHLLLEINSVATEQRYGETVEIFSASLSRVDTSAVVAQWQTTAEQAFFLDEAWVAGPSGYVQEKTVTFRYEDLGYELAHQLFSRAFAAPMHVVSGQNMKTPPPGVRQGDVRRPRPPIRKRPN